MFKKSFHIFLGLFILIGYISFSQNKKIEELTDKLKNCKTDSVRANLNYTISWEYLDINLDSALNYNQVGLMLAKKMKLEKMEAFLLDEQGYINLYKSNFENAISLHIAALKLHQKIGDRLGETNSLNGIGFIYDSQGNLDKALEYYLQSYKIIKEFKNKSSESTVLVYIGGIYQQKKEFQKALDNFHAALQCNKEKLNSMALGDIYGHLAASYSGLNINDSALVYGFNALSNYEKISKTNGRVADALNIICDIYKNQKNYEKAIEYGEKSYIMSSELGMTNEKNSSSQSLAESYALINDFKNAYKYQLIHYRIKDSIASDSKVMLLEMKYYKEKEEAIQKKEKEIILYKEKVTQWIYIGITIFLIGIVGLLFWRFKSKQKSHRQLSEKNKIIEDKQKELLDSIHYAKRIQNALLPSEKYIKRNLNNLNKN